MSTTFALLIGFLFPQPADSADTIVEQAMVSIEAIAAADDAVDAQGMRYRGIELLLLTLENRAHQNR